MSPSAGYKWAVGIDHVEDGGDPAGCPFECELAERRGHVGEGVSRFRPDVEVGVASASCQRWAIRIESSRSGSRSPTVKSEAGAVGERLAARIAQLGGEITADPSEFVERAPIDRFTLPEDPADVVGILRSRSATNEA